MNQPDPTEEYSFDEFRSRRDSTRFLGDDRFLQRVIATYAPELTADVRSDLARFDDVLSTRWRTLVETIGAHENAPHVQHYDGYNNRIDRIVRPAATLELERDVFSEGMFGDDHDPWSTFIKIFLLCQLGEAGINCAHCCTGGLVMILDEFADTPELAAIRVHMKDGVDGHHGIASQFLSEIQGGSDVAANRVRAVPGPDGWRIHGNKFFCSAAHADYAIVTAKPSGSQQVGAFVVPAWLPGDKHRERRNGHRINKLKDKLGTRELPTAEIAYDGAVAYPVGDLEAGLGNVVGIVLSHSRFITGISAGATLTRMAREASQYAHWRKAFGTTIADFGLVASQLDELQVTAERTTAASFRLQRDILSGKGLTAGAPATPEARARAAFRLRLMIMAQKMVACDDSARLGQVALSIHGANGLMEDFSALPRMYRDAVVLGGAWEGPRNLLLTRIFGDLLAAAHGYPHEHLVADLLPTTAADQVASLTEELRAIQDHGQLLGADKLTIDICRRWDRWCTDLVHAYQNEALMEVAG